VACLSPIREAKCSCWWDEAADELEALIDVSGRWTDPR
jgi:hypothetical protein